MPASDTPAPEPAAPEGAGQPDAATEPEVVEDAVPLNRAERRAKARGKAQPQAVGKIQPGRVNPGQGHRTYANRRSGGG